MAEVAVKTASTKEIPLVVAIGNMSKSVPPKINERNPRRSIWDGDSLLFIEIYLLYRKIEKMKRGLLCI
jgi:hypothetical protein